MSMSDVVGATLSSINPGPFVSGWLQSRQWRVLLSVVPVVALVAGILALRVAAYRRDSAGLFETYLAEAGESLSAGDDEGAKLRLRRAALIDPADPRVLFGLATLDDRAGETASARRTMEFLVSDPGTVGVQAAKWLLIGVDEKKIEGAERREVIAWLEKIQAAEPANLPVSVRLATTYAEDGQVDKAIDELRPLLPLQPKLRVALIRLLLGEGRKSEAIAEAEEAERVLRLEVKSNPDAKEMRFALVAVLVHLERFREASTELKEMRGSDADAELQKSISAVAGAWAAHLDQTGGSPAEILRLTGEALRTDPSNQVALSLVMKLAREAGTRDGAVELLRERLAEGDTPWLMHMLLGSVLLEKGETEQGTEHLEQSIQLNPGAAVALNNLAWTLANHEPVDLERAEVLVSKAIEFGPKNVHFRETRGQVRLKLGRWKEAVADLESVLPAYSQNAALKSHLPTLHDSLARGYEGLGNESMAAEHRKRAKSGGAKPEEKNAEEPEKDAAAPPAGAETAP